MRSTLPALLLLLFGSAAVLGFAAAFGFAAVFGSAAAFGFAPVFGSAAAPRAQEPAPRVTSPLAAPTPETSEMVADLLDEETVRRLLARSFSIEDAYRDPALREQLAAEVRELMQAAERRVARANTRLAIANAQVDSGRLSADTLRPLAADAQNRLDAYQLALMQSRLVEDVLEDARADQARARGRATRHGAVERFAGSGRFTPADLRMIQTAYARKFFQPLPISAFGETALHRTLGLNHTGKVDVALNPDQREGLWLRDYLERRGIPYYAFRTAILGLATAPHIHIGTGSSRLAPRPAAW